MIDPLLRYPGYLVRRAAMSVTAELGARLAEIDLRIVDFSMLILIEANPNVTSSQLSRKLDVQRANMVLLVRRLEEAGLIRRDPIDGKSHGFQLTDAGQARASAGRRITERFEDELINRVAPEHRDHLMPVLQALWL